VKRYLIILFLLQSLDIAHARSVIQSGEFMHCYDFGCKSTQAISFDNAQWSKIEQLFTPPSTSAWQEKQQIRRAIAMMETFAGELTGTKLDKGGNYSSEELPFQQDCIDESTNTFQYLRALQQRKLLQWHQVDKKKRRIVWFFTHWTAVIRQKDNNELFAVDSWYLDNGELPYIQKLDEWQRKATFSESLNPPISKM